MSVMSEPKLTQRQAALQSANRRRVDLAQLRRELRADPLLLRRVLQQPPECLRGMPIIDVIRLAWSSRRAKANRWIGLRALADDVNLMVPVEMASRRTRDWASEHGTTWCQIHRER